MSQLPDTYVLSKAMGYNGFHWLLSNHSSWYASFSSPCNLWLVLNAKKKKKKEKREKKKLVTGLWILPYPLSSVIVRNPKMAPVMANTKLLDFCSEVYAWFLSQRWISCVLLTLWNSDIWNKDCEWQMDCIFICLFVFIAYNLCTAVHSNSIHTSTIVDSLVLPLPQAMV